MELNKIYCEDCLETLARLEDNSIDLVVTSPPYNKNAYATDKGGDKSWSALRGRQIPYDKYNDAMPPQEYEAWQKKVISECLRVLKPHGSLFYNHKDILVGGGNYPTKVGLRISSASTDYMEQRFKPCQRPPLFSTHNGVYLLDS